MMAGILLEMGGKAKKGEGLRKAKEILESGKAYKKFIEIIKAQGGKEKSPGEIAIGKFKFDFNAKKAGKIASIKNTSISKIARVAGAPQDNGAGLYLYKHIGDKVKKGEKIFTIYAHNKIKLDFAKKTMEILDGVAIR